jgi:hypothetical protein
MSGAGNQPWMRGPGSRHGFRYSGSDLRVSDAERQDVAERLSKHYADGRLDQNEFNERLEQAMSAKTRSDLGGLFIDLPNTEGEPAPVRRQRWSGPHLHYVLIVVLVLVLASALVHSVLWLGHQWLIVGLVLAILLLRHDGRRRRRW